MEKSISSRSGSGYGSFHDSAGVCRGRRCCKEDLKVGIIYIGDENEGYSAAHMAGIDEMVENLGLEEDQVIEKTLIGENEAAYDAAADLADQGCQIVFANSFWS